MSSSAWTRRRPTGLTWVLIVSTTLRSPTDTPANLQTKLPIVPTFEEEEEGVRVFESFVENLIDTSREGFSISRNFFWVSISSLFPGLWKINKEDDRYNFPMWQWDNTHAQEKKGGRGTRNYHAEISNYKYTKSLSVIISGNKIRITARLLLL